MKKLFGSGVALVTPFDEIGKIDFKALKRLLIYTAKGVDYFVVMGTTGESATLSKEEKKSVLKFVLENNPKKLPIVYGIGGNNTQSVLDELTSTDLKGVTAILSVSPYYNKPPQEGIFQHYKALDAVAPLPIIMYNVPSRTGQNVSGETTVRIAKECKKIFATKEACGNFDQINYIIKNKPADFMVISGDDPITLHMIAAGAEGLISVVANAYPLEYSEMVRLCLKGNFKEAQLLHYKYTDIIASMFAEGSPSGVKAYLSEMGLCPNTFRLPVWPVSEKHHQKIKELMKD